MKHKPTKKRMFLALAVGLFALAFAATRGGSRPAHGAAYFGPVYGGCAGAYGNFSPQFRDGYHVQRGVHCGGSGEGWYGGDFHSNTNLGTAVSSSGGSGYIAVGGGDFVSW